ncbi:hypothetical protein DFP72DRAFT_872069 [Ephemerocybe angulata]|uniref:DUF6699 domain-containing protein n=1 Tax=Ephemerocybe angulata TaxID=980116 RepID=A0A8H6IHJ0_9AGAR|nr:hypothetical protein DFP72DRAFT_872069 [Tulosesus angulatus]
MHYSPTSTTYVTSAPPGSQYHTLHLVARGPSSPSSVPLSPIGAPLYGFHNMPQPQASSHAGSHGWENQQPPRLNHAMSPHATVPLPSLTNGRMEVNPVLEYAPTPMVDWDLTSPSSFATFDARRRSARSRSLEEPATYPCATSVTIRTPFSSRPIVLQQFGATITVRDVLTGVHEHLRQCAYEAVSPRPRTSLLEPQAQFGMVSEAQIQHALRQLLGRKSRWAGLSPSRTEPDVWHLHVR